VVWGKNNNKWFFFLENNNKWFERGVLAAAGASKQDDEK